MGALFLFLFCLYWAPTVVAAFRDHPRAGTLFLVNFCFGWTIIGWAACLIWAWTQGKSPD